jgi:hypothetical protein
VFRESTGAPRPVGRKTPRAADFDWLCYVYAPVLSRTAGVAAINCANAESGFPPYSYLRRLPRSGSKPARSHGAGLRSLQRAEFFALPVLNSFY